MTELNWNMFEATFNGKQQSAFERLAYGLFCSRFDQHNGIFAHKNQSGIETEPIEINGRWIGFQAKYLAPSTIFSSKKKEFIQSLVKAKEKNPSLDEICFYVNKTYSESKKKGQKHPQYIIEIQEKAKELNLSIEWQVPSHIQKQLSLSQNLEIAKEFFPDFANFHRLLDTKNAKNELLEVVKTGVTLIEIEKVIHENTDRSWEAKENILSKFYQFTKHSNEVINTIIFDYLEHISNQTRSKMPSSIAGEIFSLIFKFFPASYGNDEKEERVKNGEICLEIGFNLVYDAAIYLHNYRIIEYGLNIWKYIYREGRRKNITEWTKSVVKKYEEIEQNLNRPERKDLENSKELIQIFKEDLESWDLKSPVLPDHLYKLVEESE